VESDHGKVSACWKDHGGVSGKDLFQTEASINQGNSGEPRLHDSGHIIGITTPCLPARRPTV
jgi:serine protease Do